jgi:hypothetical protein
MSKRRNLRANSARSSRPSGGALDVSATRAEAGPPGAGDLPALHVAVVHTANAVHLVTAATSRAALTDRLSDYVRRRAGSQLWPNDARRLRRLLAKGQLDEAIELYFASVGERWDEERLVTSVVQAGERLSV